VFRNQGHTYEVWQHKKTGGVKVTLPKGKRVNIECRTTPTGEGLSEANPKQADNVTYYEGH